MQISWSIYIYDVIDAFAREFSIFSHSPAIKLDGNDENSIQWMSNEKIISLLLLSSQQNSIVLIMQYESSREQSEKKKSSRKTKLFQFHLRFSFNYCSHSFHLRNKLRSRNQ